MGLSSKVKETLSAIEGFIAVNHMSPTYRELQYMLGLNSIAPVQLRLRRLKELGLIETVYNQARSIRLTASPFSIPSGCFAYKVSNTTEIFRWLGEDRLELDSVVLVRKKDGTRVRTTFENVLSQDRTIAVRIAIWDESRSLRGKAIEQG